MPAWVDALVVPFLLGLGGLITWIIRDRIEHRRSLEAGLTDQRRRTYADILEPYIKAFVKARTNDPATQADVEKLITSYEYRRAFFDLGLFGSDPVVRAYNALMQHIYKSGDLPPSERQQAGREMIRLWGQLLLRIRREGNPSTSLTEWEMLEGLIKDIEKLRG